MLPFAEHRESMEVLAAVFFACAVLHTFAVKKINQWAERFQPGSIAENLCHFLGEVEVVFGVWAAFFVTLWSLRFGTQSAISFLNGVHFAEPAFVFVIMCMAATKPVLDFASWSVDALSRLLPFPRAISLYSVTLIVGPLLGSAITEPAAMTVTALLLKEHFFHDGARNAFKYATMGLLFVSISVGGTLTHFAAPPVLMVAGPWGWNTPFMMQHFGWRAIIFVTLAVPLTAFWFRKDIEACVTSPNAGVRTQKPVFWMSVSHFLFMTLTILHSHQMVFFIPLFLFFIGWCAVTKEHQSDLKLRESLLVAFFLGGLVTLGQLQGWWLRPIIETLGHWELYAGTMTLTAFTDNAALTYLGTLVPQLSAEARYFLVAGAVVGGGLTVIANAPNPAGYGILQPAFGESGVSPLYLFLGALPFTLFAALIFAL